MRRRENICWDEFDALAQKHLTPSLPRQQVQTWRAQRAARLAQHEAWRFAWTLRLFMAAHGMLVVDERPTPAGKNQLQQAEIDTITKALVAHGGVQLAAAHALGVSPRLLHHKIRKFGLHRYCHQSLLSRKFRLVKAG